MEQITSCLLVVSPCGCTALARITRGRRPRDRRSHIVIRQLCFIPSHGETCLPWNDTLLFNKIIKVPMIIWVCWTWTRKPVIHVRSWYSLWMEKRWVMCFAYDELTIKLVGLRNRLSIRRLINYNFEKPDFQTATQIDQSSSGYP